MKHKVQNYRMPVALVFVGIVSLQLLVAALSIEVQSSVRAYVSGESLYSKGQKDALLHLRSYAESHDESDFRQFIRALEVPEGDASARRALERTPPDRDAARQGFLAGQNGPQDIDRLIRLFLLAHDTPFMSTAVAVWERADNTLAELRRRAVRLHDDIGAGRPDGLASKQLMALLPEMNERLTRLEREFSAQLGHSAQLVQTTLLVVNMAIAVLLSGIGVRHIRHTLRAQQRMEAEMTELVGAVGDGVLMIDVEQRIVLLNRAAEQLFGHAAIRALGAPIQRLIPDSLPLHKDPASACDSESVRALHGRHADGRQLHLEASVSPMTGASGIHTVIVCRDVTARHLAQERAESQHLLRHQELERKAYTDALTGLPNREAMELHLGNALFEAQNRGSPLSVLFLDVDGFKGVNDRHGHLCGDELLRRIADRLHGAVRDEDKVFRVGGDEFVVVASEQVSPDLAQVIAKRLVGAIRHQFDIDGALISVTGSVGIASYPRDGGDARSLLLAADTAMYRAKKTGRDSFHVCTPASILQLEKPELVLELEKAIRNDELVLYYQPIVSAGDASAVGAEALVRWQHPTRGLLAPRAFIPLAESYGLCNRIGEWVLDRALRDLSTVSAGRLKWLTVNLAASQLLDADLPRRLERLLMQYDVPAAHLGVELTESMAMRDVRASHAVLQAIRECGVSVSLDDFGTGYSSLSQLHEMPVDKLKIDRSFIERVSDDEGAARIVEAIAALALTMGLSVVAEGVQTAAQIRALRRLRIHEFQGYGIGRPMRWEALQHFSKAWRGVDGILEQLDAPSYCA